MSERNEIHGTLLKLEPGGFYPTVFILSHDHIPRSQAITIAKKEMLSPEWCGIPRVVFLHESGEVETWSPEKLRTKS